MQELELLSPAKNIEVGICAISHGADAVYIGGPGFGARANASNSLDDLEKLVKYAHQYNARIYLTLNTILKDEELESAVKLAHDAWNIGIDALIVQDLGLLLCDLPPIQLHASTQCDIRTPEKAKFLEEVGFSQIVPARELSLSQIADIYSVLDKARIEFFIHGALCVSFSGQCYASQVLKHRSANRGECSQICRLPFDVYGDDNQLLASNRHVLSLKDNNQSENIAKLIDAGVRSFKIEGRYKDAPYVKNITAHYRRLIDSYLSGHSGYLPSSDGIASFNFEPDITNAFNRGGTDYFVNGRHPGIVSPGSPKKTGESIGTVLRIEPNSIIVKSEETFNNGDGLTFWKNNGELSGFLVNKAESFGDFEQSWRLSTREPTSRIPGLETGLTLMRNKNAAWLKKMAATTAIRKIPIKIEADISKESIKVIAKDANGHVASIEKPNNFEEAQNQEVSRQNIEKSLSKLGSTIFSADSISIEGNTLPFLPASFINELRRATVEKLKKIREENFTKLPRSNSDSRATFPTKNGTVDYHANVLNSKAKEFYELHGVKVIETAIEDGHTNPQVELMRCKHCIRYSLNLCPKEAIKRGEKIKPTPLKLRYGKTELTAKFHCKECEMSICLAEN